MAVSRLASQAGLDRLGWNTASFTPYLGSVGPIADGYTAFIHLEYWVKGHTFVGKTPGAFRYCPAFFPI